MDGGGGEVQMEGGGVQMDGGKVDNGDMCFECFIDCL